ncbi:MAG: oligoendopeptidase F [Eubacteriales bacterium]|nr:oligoendopeptidase F [Eubacteriales bacterium]MDY3333084.1 oligoendopeptidase F [Gallibacter sp.]
MKVKNRSEIPQEFKWDIEDMYSDETLWEKDIEEAIEDSVEFAKYEEKILDSASNLLRVCQLRDKIWQKIEKVYVYARMRRDEDNTNSKYQAMSDKASMSIAKIQSNTYFFTSEVISAEFDLIKKYINEEPKLEIYLFMFENMFREKQHVLTKTEENIIAQYSEITPTTNNIFTMLNNADIQFAPIQTPDGEKELTHGNYIAFMESSDVNIRKQAFESMYTSYKNLINTIATIYNYRVKTNVINSKLRKYDSCMESFLKGDNVSKDVYNNLIDVVHEYLPYLHKYIELRKKLLGVDELKMHDVYCPLIQYEEDVIEYNNAKDIISTALQPLGETYVNDLLKGLNSGWVDIYENKNKTSGAYSFGSYDSKPYILMNYSNKLKDVFTLIHELGHSMHSYYTRANQPYIYGGHSIFTAEVASTVNENLLIKHLIKNTDNIEKKKYLINYHIEEFRTTLFRQTMFAEFEKWTHESVEASTPLSANSMCKYYEELNKKYFGDAIADDDFIKYEWARIPHFYNAFYVYKYATGYSAASAISEIILKDGADNYLEFLKTGESNHPIELLKIAGVDMSSPAPIREALDVFKQLVEEFEALI